MSRGWVTAQTVKCLPCLIVPEFGLQNSHAKCWAYCCMLAIPVPGKGRWMDSWDLLTLLSSRPTRELMIKKKGESQWCLRSSISGCFGCPHSSTHMNIHTPTHVYTYMSTIEPYSVLGWLQAQTSHVDCISCLHQEALLRQCPVLLTLYKHTLGCLLAQ